MSKPDPTSERLKEKYNYDSETGKLTRRIKTRECPVGSDPTWIDPQGYHKLDVDRKIIAAHRVVWIYMVGSIPESMEIDHINGVRSDNRIENLRLVTKSQNRFNTGVRSNNKSGYKGVCKQKGNRYVANIMIRGKTIRLGSYATAQEASAAYIEKAKELQGEFFPDQHRTSRLE